MAAVNRVVPSRGVQPVRKVRSAAQQQRYARHARFSASISPGYINGCKGYRYENVVIGAIAGLSTPQASRTLYYRGVARLSICLSKVFCDPLIWRPGGVDVWR